MKSKALFISSWVVHLIALSLFIYVRQDLDVFSVLAFIFVPFLISLVICLCGQLKELKSNVIKNRGLLYSIPSVIYLSVAYYFINKNIDDIFASSQKFQSEQINITTSNSPFFSFFILLVITIVLHYAIASIGVRKAKKDITL